MSSHTGQLIIPIAAALLSLAAQRQSFAGSATWSANPASGDWNTATNWTANTVPNGPADIATFGASNVTNLSSNIVVNLDSIVFNTGAASFTITSGAGTNIIFAGRGIINNSGVVQSFVKIPNGAIFFFNDASAGELTRFASVGGAIYFDDSSSAASARTC